MDITEVKTTDVTPYYKNKYCRSANVDDCIKLTNLANGKQSSI